MNNLNTSEDQIDPVSLLKCYVEWGVDETITEEPINWFTETDKIQIKQQTAQVSSQVKTPQNAAAQSAPLASQTETIALATEVAKACNSLDELKSAILEFDGCSLKKTATNTVFCDGNAESKVMVIGEAPGADEDRIGKPFLGEAGKLLDKMFAAIEMSRENDFYITNVVPWRPPGNRKPTDAECDLCLPFLKRHIELLQPKIIISIGGTSANALLGTQTGITKLRGKWQEYDVSGTKVPIVPIYHPAYLIRQPQFKKQTWHDLLDIKAKLREL
ncbi:uracil-DNA glycosylase [Pseudemcibacter aquimaris]|uniref:uracil-DNA glycosylase n=1 Tax=Pseudemcibacter aquimaris TaxID=2857064 RepID=UPI0020116218|nr:uracil-DNA glycosylase [Pseudemcibacter aquimaris]MCC3859679.1 uracil-DNA glycosylase [Pseudemcibacter aquimaris]WDU60074.1 uracil-DNA glycosylase [Pseudemcibacter aquimaris]